MTDRRDECLLLFQSAWIVLPGNESVQLVVSTNTQVHILQNML